MKTCNRCQQTKEDGDFYDRRAWCKACEAARVQAWRSSNPAKRNRLSKLYASRHPDKMVANQTRYVRLHPERKADVESRRRARMTAVEIPASEKRAIRSVYALARTKRRIRCFLCGVPTVFGERHVDHVRPIASGGLHVASNLAIVHNRCNNIKATKLPEQMGVLL